MNNNIPDVYYVFCKSDSLKRIFKITKTKEGGFSHSCIPSVTGNCWSIKYFVHNVSHKDNYLKESASGNNIIDTDYERLKILVELVG